MKKIFPHCLILMALLGFINESKAQCVHITECELCAEVPDSLIVSDPVARFDSLPQPAVNYDILNLSFGPKVFSGYQQIQTVPQLSKKGLKYNLQVTTAELEESDENLEMSQEILETPNDTIISTMEILSPVEETTSEILGGNVSSDLPNIQKYKTPAWLKNEIQRTAAQENLLYAYMIDNPLDIEYAYWDLPLPPVLLEEDRSFKAFLAKQIIPDVNPEDAILPETEIKKKHWLHTVNSLLQFSQAYVSPNWYQGGNNYLSLLFGFNWNVQLNQVYHPNLLFQSDLSYKVAFTSNPSGSYHKYTIAEDNFQYNLNAGLKAIKNWYYSFNLQFKTQLFNNYETDSDVRTASFLSPGDLNMGLGMSYTHKNKLNTFNYTLTISPLSYNLKTCISNKVNHQTYGIDWDKKTKSEIGSNIDFTMEWKITANISYKTRLFMFTNYHYFLADWQNTFNFEINKFLSTQLFVHPRYDGSIESTANPHWKKFMLREILSFGLSYTFSTKP